MKLGYECALGYECIDDDDFLNALKGRCQDLGIQLMEICRDADADPHIRPMTLKSYNRCVLAIDKKAVMVVDVLKLSLAEVLNMAERNCILIHLDLTNGNVSAAAIEMGIDRSTLTRKMKNHGIIAERKTHAV